MHVEYLYYFKDFSETLSISKTATNFYMTPQGVSRAIHQLEKDFGVTLTSYRNNVISLTPAGRELSRQVDGVIDALERVKGTLAGYRLAEIGGGARHETVRVTVTPCVSQYVATFLDIQKPGQFPFNVKFKESNVYRVVPHIVARGGEDSFGFISIPAIEKYWGFVQKLMEESDMEYEALFTSPLVALVSAYSPLAGKSEIVPGDVDGCSVARYQDTVLGDALDDYIREECVKTVTNATPVIYARIMENQFISFAPKLIEGVGVLPDRIRTVPTRGFFSTEFGVLVPRVDGESPRVQEVISFMKKRVREGAERGRFAGTFELAQGR
ncbi:LysR family transcriptional regulator [Adlercreutzia sp. ZJ473]|nr:MULTISPECIES: LysR family transcriptional regulator [unclassified Adlercreutzia]